MVNQSGVAERLFADKDSEDFAKLQWQQRKGEPQVLLAKPVRTLLKECLIFTAKQP